MASIQVWTDAGECDKLISAFIGLNEIYRPSVAEAAFEGKLSSKHVHKNSCRRWKTITQKEG